MFLVAAGKAAWVMASSYPLDVLEGVVAGPRSGSGALPPQLEWFDAAHPYPNAASEAAGRRALAIAARSGTRGTLLVLLSGGASSMLAVPGPTLTLADKADTSRALMNAGVAIADLNCVRKHLSAIKGGRLAALAGRTITLAISDVHGPVADDPSAIGSGPTVADPTTFADALAIVRRAGVAALVPAPVLACLERAADESPKPGDPRLRASSYHVIANRHTAVEGAARAARARGYAVRIVEAATSGEARDVGAAFAANGLREAGAPGSTPGAPVCLIASGETTVHVRGSGRGGRNQEFALGSMPVLDSLAAPGTAAVVASAGTDGIDGPTDAAGAVVDSSSSARARLAGLDPAAALASNGSYDFFAPLGDLTAVGADGNECRRRARHADWMTPSLPRRDPQGFQRFAGFRVRGLVELSRKALSFVHVSERRVDSRRRVVPAGVVVARLHAPQRRLRVFEVTAGVAEVVVVEADSRVEDLTAGFGEIELLTRIVERGLESALPRRAPPEPDAETDHQRHEDDQDELAAGCHASILGQDTGREPNGRSWLSTRPGPSDPRTGQRTATRPAACRLPAASPRLPRSPSARPVRPPAACTRD